MASEDDGRNVTKGSCASCVYNNYRSKCSFYQNTQTQSSDDEGGTGQGYDDDEKEEEEEGGEEDDSSSNSEPECEQEIEQEAEDTVEDDNSSDQDPYDDSEQRDEFLQLINKIKNGELTLYHPHPRSLNLISIA